MKKNKFKNYVSSLLFLMGIFVFFYFIAFPIVELRFYESDSFKFKKPFPGTVLSYSYSSLKDNDFKFKELQGGTKKVEEKEYEDTFQLSIPQLGIKDAVVKTHSKELDPDDFLGHYVGTSTPGQVGNMFIYGHSSLPVLYDPNDYKTIFTKLPKLKKGSKVIVNYGNKKYTYTVKVKKELLPEEVDPYGSFYPSFYNKSTLTLMTCTPPGFVKYRYIVLAELE